MGLQQARVHRQQPEAVDAVTRQRELLFNALPEARAWDTRDLNRLFAHSGQMRVPPDTVLIEPRNICEQFIVLLDGSVRVYQNAEDGRELTIYRVDPGDVCVMSLNSLLKHQRFNATAISETPVRAISMDKSFFMHLMSRYQTFAVRVLGSLTQHFSKAVNLLGDTVFSRLEERLVSLLGNLFKASGGRAIRVTHQQLANELGTTREVVSRLLKQFEHQQRLALSRGKISLHKGTHPTWIGQHHLS